MFCSLVILTLPDSDFVFNILFRLKLLPPEPSNRSLLPLQFHSHWKTGLSFLLRLAFWGAIYFLKFDTEHDFCLLPKYAVLYRLPVYWDP